jgi:hypothetical protein
MVLQQHVEHADRIAIGGGADTDRLHRPGQPIDKATFDELQRLRGLTCAQRRERLAEQPRAQDIAPVHR